MWGNASGGYADELRLKSSPADEEGGNGTYINLRAHGGSLDFENTRVSRAEPSRQNRYRTSNCFGKGPSDVHLLKSS